MKKKTSPVEIVVIADRSGSMDAIRADAIGGYNAFLAEQQKIKGAANLTLILFDHEYIVAEDAVPLKNAKPLTTETYVPRGATALNDAIGRSLASLEAKKPDKAIVCILTDGAENASSEFTTAQVRQKISDAEKAGWKIVYLSADANAFAHSAAFGISKDATVKFNANGAGVRSAYATATASTTNYRGK